MICAMVSYALMNLVMTSTPLAMVGCGFATPQAADVVSGHVLAMFAPSFFTGALIARFGVGAGDRRGPRHPRRGRRGGADRGQASRISRWRWSCSGSAGTSASSARPAMLTAAHTPEERGRVQGMNDFAVFGLVALASLASGGLMNCSGGDAVAGWTAVNLAMAPFLAAGGRRADLAGGALAASGGRALSPQGAKPRAATLGWRS